MKQTKIKLFVNNNVIIDQANMIRDGGKRITTIDSAKKQIGKTFKKIGIDIIFH